MKKLTRLIYHISSYLVIQMSDFGNDNIEQLYYNQEQDIQIRECQQKLEEYRAVLEKYRNKLTR